jgi:hypothetical protein
MPPEDESNNGLLVNGVTASTVRRGGGVKAAPRSGVSAPRSGGVGRHGRSNNRSAGPGTNLFVVFLAMGFGLLFTIGNAWYIMNYLHEQERLIIQAELSSNTTNLEEHHVDRVRLLLENAGVNVKDLPEDKQRQIPTWPQVVALYGDQPVLVGLETCAPFKASGGGPAEHYIGVAGTFNTGTNLLSELLIANCRNPARQFKHGRASRGVRWQGM